jgi:enterochelin esterase-like enzyme
MRDPVRLSWEAPPFSNRTDPDDEDRPGLIFEGAQRLADLLKKNDIRHTFHESDGGHSWFAWRRYLAEFLPLLFVEKS